MAQEIQTVGGNRIAELMTLMTPQIASVLAVDCFEPKYATGRLKSLHVNVPELRGRLKSALEPVSSAWLDRRLRLMWKHSNVSAGIDATAWLHETMRLLSDLPEDIVAEAIDAALRASARGFMPTVGEIRSYADPRLRERRQQLWRIEEVAKFSPTAPLAKEDRCTPEQAARIRKEAGIRYDDDTAARSPDWIPVEQRSAPTRADYPAWGVDPADIPGEAA